MLGHHRSCEAPPRAEGWLTRARGIRLAPAARRWLAKEITYLTNQNPAAASRVARLFDAAWERIARHPLIGPKGELDGTRIVVVGPYIVTLKIRDGKVEIGAIRHGHQADARAPTDLAADSDPDPT